MLFVLLGILYILPIIIFNFVINRYDAELEKMPFTAEEFGRRVLDERNLHSVTIEPVNTADHYDPETKSIRIKSERLKKKSVTAIAIICHEIGHAIQDSDGYEPLKRRQTIIKYTEWIQRLTVGVSLIGIAPIIATGMIPLIKFVALFMVIGILTTVIIHLTNLDVEFDASFNKAMPILKENIPQAYHKQCRYILSAAAFTYVIGALSSIFTLRYWLIFLRSIKR